ncbi:adenylate/guanylate cyclase domain-containing protein [Treponema sp.]|uniref:adenylate/guanylate cyclase domain-containing protein n=1 Tax=Treponema sp. TaxID=166 RepID=UPI00298E091E|nr:7TM diverse intracellular signaling domain-containing protein [Treponema sp.]MCR5613787.1 adenylate/guanylate cyclase domain-containing protein [Treponema sp.]
MKKRVFLIFILFSLFAVQFAGAVEHSGIYLSNPNFPESGYVEIDGKWDYFDSRYISPKVFYRDGFVRSATAKDLRGEVVTAPHIIKSKKGYATYHCLLSNLKPFKCYSMMLHKEFVVCTQMFVNGKCVYDEDKIKSYTSDDRAILYMRSVDFTADRQGYADLVFYVKNYEQKIGGLVYIPKFAEDKFVQKSILNNIIVEMLVSGVFIILTIYNLIIFFLNRTQKMYLWLSALSLNLLFVTCTLDFSLIGYFRSVISVAANLKLNLFFLGMIIPLYNLYAVNLYDIKLKLNAFVLTIDFAVPLLVLFLPVEIVSNLVLTFMCITYAASLYLCVIIAKRRTTSGNIAVPNIVMIIVMLITAAYGLSGLIYPQKQDGIVTFKIAIMMFAFMQSVIAGIKRNSMAKQIRANLAKYERLNASYLRYIPTQVLNFLQIENSKNVAPGDNAICDAMILVTSIKKFGELCESVSTETIYDLLRRYYDVAAPVVREYGGYICKYANDEMIVVFTDLKDIACQCAIELQKRMGEVKKAMNIAKIKFEGLQSAVHCGKISIGFMGNNLHVNASVCSKEIIQATRICEINDKINSRILVSEKALNYCRTYTDCLFDGFVEEIDGEKTVLYRVRSFEDAQYDFSVGELG